jgi:signal transduction histidine kinase
MEVEQPDEVFPLLLKAAQALGFPRGLVLEVDWATRRIGPVAELRWPGARLNQFRASLSSLGNELAGVLRATQPVVMARSGLHNKPIYVHPVVFRGRNLCGATDASGCLAVMNSRSGDRPEEQVCHTCGIRGYPAAVVVELPAARNEQAIKELARLIESASRQRFRLEWIRHARQRPKAQPGAGTGEPLGLEPRRVEIEKFAATGRLAATIAHEINNPMQAIKTAIYLLAGSIPTDAMPVYNILKSETERVARIVRQMLGLYRNTEQVKPVNVNTIIEDTLNVFQRPLERAGIEIQSELGALPDAVIAADQIRQVLSNLVLNARDAMPDGGKLRIRSRHIAAAADPHGWVRVLVADSGTGIELERVAEIFEAFVTTKGEKGIGLGLWIVKGIIQSHAGRVSVKSKRGRGTVFRIDLPVAKV